MWQAHDGVELPGGHFPLCTGATSQAIRQCTPQLIRWWSKEGPPVKVQYATDRPALPESSITVPVVFDGEVMGVLSIQAYEPEAYDQQDVVLVQGVADMVATAIAAQRPQHGDEGEILASMADALLVLDEQARLVRINQAARRMLSLEDSSLILGQPVDRPQADRWPLGTRGLTEQLLPIVEQLKRGAAPRHEVHLALDGMPDHKVSCRASVLMREGSPAGGVVVLRELTAAGGS
jgi:PAS domain-containing protein